MIVVACSLCSYRRTSENFGSFRKPSRRLPLASRATSTEQNSSLCVVWRQCARWLPQCQLPWKRTSSGRRKMAKTWLGKERQELVRWLHFLWSVVHVDLSVTRVVWRRPWSMCSRLFTLFHAETPSVVRCLLYLWFVMLGVEICRPTPICCVLRQ